MSKQFFRAASANSRLSQIGNELNGGMLTGFKSLEAFRRQNPLPVDAQRIIDDTVTRVGGKRLQLVKDFIAAGMVTNLPNWIGVPSVYRERVSNAGYAHRGGVPGESQHQRSRVDMTGDSYPIFTTWDVFDYTIFEEGAAERVGLPLDTTHIENSVNNVEISIEEQAIYGLMDEDGNPMKIAGLSAPGILNSTTVFTYPAWDTLTGKEIHEVVKEAVETQRLKGKRGPWNLYMPANYTVTLNRKYSDAYDSPTIFDSLATLGPYGGEKIKPQILDALPDGQVVLVQMDKNSATVYLGTDPYPISWLVPPGFRRNHVIIACTVTAIHIDHEGNYGVVVGSEE